MVILGVGVFVGFQGEWYSIERDTYSFYDETGFADYRLIDEKGYSVNDLDKIKAINGVKKASQYISINTNESKDNDVIALTVTTDIAVSGFKLIKGNEYDETSLNGVWMSDLYANANDYKIGDSITIKYNSFSIEGKIEGLVKSSEYLICITDESQIMPDYTKNGFIYISPAMYEATLGFAYYPQINVISDLKRSEFIELADEKLGKTNLILTKDEVVSFEEAQGEATEGKTMASIIPVVFLGIAILIMVTTMQRLTINEKTQIGTLKALGFRDKRIVKHYTFFGSFIGIVGSILGIGLGYFITWFIFNPNGSMGTYFDLPSWKLYFPWWTFLIILILIAFMTFISFLATKQVLKGNAVDTLKPYTPKAMKRLKIEDSKSWRKLKFQTKWNLRDIIRHKARSGMTLFGVIGCIILLVATFLMMDSMKGFVDKFYYGAMNYKTMINLANETTNDKAIDLANYFTSDYSAYSSVSLNEGAITMEIYNVDNNYVKFLDINMKYIELSNDGVYISERIKEENNLTIGDKFYVYIYGSDVKYELTVAGEVRSLSKGIVMSEEYADSVGIDYHINRIYTNKTTEEINQNETYKEYISSTKSKSDVVKSFDSFMEVLYTMIGALIVLSIILGVVVLYNLGAMSYFERYRELSTLKVVGFKDKKIGKLLIIQNMWLTIVGVVVGFPLGVIVTSVLVKALASEYEIKVIFGWLTIVIPIVLVLATSLVVSLFIAKKNKHINMVEALKVPE